MKAGISKAELIKNLEFTLKLTRERIDSLELRDEDTVVIWYEDGHNQPVNIACNSGVAIISDVCRYIYRED